jgi:uncharacterized protein YecE (DUF72 family)
MNFGAVSDINTITFPVKLPWNIWHEINKPASHTKFYIGCPVWSDKDYVGKFYPEKTSPKNYLKAYGQQFNTVEVNGTRFGMPQKETILKWKGSVPDDFVFSFKLPQSITHRKDWTDKDAMTQLDKYFEYISLLEEKAGMTYMLMPPYVSMKYIDRLMIFLEKLPIDFYYALEIRDKELVNYQPLIEFLSYRNVPLVITDTPGRQDVVHYNITSDVLFVRFLGALLHQTDYERIDVWVNEILQLAKKGIREVYFFIHQPGNHHAMCGTLVKYMLDKLNQNYSVYR